MSILEYLSAHWSTCSQRCTFFGAKTWPGSRFRLQLHLFFFPFGFAFSCLSFSVFFCTGRFSLASNPINGSSWFPTRPRKPGKKKTRYETKSTTGRKRLLTGRTSMKSYKTQLNLLRADQDHEDGYDGSGISLL